MVHISELAWSRVEKPDAIVQPGDSVQVKVIDIDEGKRPNTKKIALSMKQVTEDPWNQASEHFKEGEVLKGKVMRCAAFGVFVEIAPGIEGLVHISEMSYRRRVTKPEEMVTPGDSVNVMIKSLDIEHRKISLSIRDAAGDPWLEVPEKYAVGQTIEATIEKKERFGFFMSLEPGIQGLLPRSKISASPASTQIEKLKVGDTITVTLCSIDPNQRKISLEPSDSGASGDWRQYAAQPQKSMGALGEKLKAALASKKSR
jgi:small subunit ribosomal protein S1